ncbi:MAG TPA: vitamin K epoxide reductase family protein, partial [Burkholderiaceae bacterium]|nr:vitamin K epoxide reductase family protein [Burkholderiaceae bacterium]
MVTITRVLGHTPAQLRDALREDDSPQIRYRRAQVATNLVGIAMMALTTLLQTGLVRNLPEPRSGRIHWKTRKVNTSDEAFSYGGPDSPINLVAHSVNIVLASTGPAHRARRHPWLPLLATVTAGAQAAVAAKYLFHQMPYVDRAWCPY